MLKKIALWNILPPLKIVPEDHVSAIANHKLVKLYLEPIQRQQVRIGEPP